MIRVNSEVERLRRVIVQPPGLAHERMLPEHILPSSSSYLLFDDLVHVSQAQAEHAQLCAVLSTVSEVVRFDALLAEVLADTKARAQVIAAIGGLHDLPDTVAKQLEDLDAEALAGTLIAGTLGGVLDKTPLLPPVPNLIFTRDLAAVVGEVVVVSNASKRARRRESTLAWAVVDHHPMFDGAQIPDVSRAVRSGSRVTPLTVEGGDVLVISSSLVCIGASERTSWSMIINLAESLLDTGFTRILVVEMPKKRSSMHLDTVFTQVDWDRGVVYGPLLEPGGPEEGNVIRLRRLGGATVVDDLDGDLFDALAQEGHPLQPVLCGGGHPIHQEREQWTDGANYLAMGPGVVVGYARNEHTAEQMKSAGFRLVGPEEYLRELSTEFHDDPEALLSSGRRYAIHIPGSELSRGRGGPRCLTWPVWRD